MKLTKLLCALSCMGGTSLAIADETMTVKAETVAAIVNPPVVEAVQKNDATVLVSPRTGMRYTVNNPNNVPIVFKTELLASATAANANRIVAANPALSTVSQEKAQAALTQLVSTSPQSTATANTVNVTTANPATAQ